MKWIIEYLVMCFLAVGVWVGVTGSVLMAFYLVSCVARGVGLE